jgi:hypothetical protein
MGNLFTRVGEHVQGQHPDAVVLEIGSDRFEGSTYYFADLAQQHGMKFATVDLDHMAIQRAQRNIPQDWHNNCEFHCAEAVEWTKNTLLENIKVLYLDNFDWDWETTKTSTMIQEQQTWYQRYGLTMSNMNSQISHLIQMANLLPRMSDQCVICVDDTYTYNGVYIGKGGTVVPYLLMHGFGLLQSRDNGVILGRGYKNYIV